MQKTDLESILEPHVASTAEEIQRCYPIMHQLRPHLEERTFADQVMRQMTEGYCLVYLADSGRVQALAGYRILEFLAWGKVLYIDDLITDSRARKKGYGGKILKWIIDQAKLEGCDQVHLDSGPQRHEAHKLYLNHGFKIIGYHFALDFGGNP
jgi:GNAT superfamily N-acetyltransferase